VYTHSPVFSLILSLSLSHFILILSLTHPGTSHITQKKKQRGKENSFFLIVFEQGLSRLFFFFFYTHDSPFFSILKKISRRREMYGSVLAIGER
jgi:hypothetical protein